MKIYQIDILTKEHQWKQVFESDDIKVIDKVAWKLTNIRPDKAMRVLKEDKVLCFFDGSIHQYMWWKNYYVRENSIYKRLEKRKKL